MFSRQNPDSGHYKFASTKLSAAGAFFGEKTRSWKFIVNIVKIMSKIIKIYAKMKFSDLAPLVWKSFRDPVGVFCTPLEPPKSHIRQKSDFQDFQCIPQSSVRFDREKDKHHKTQFRIDFSHMNLISEIFTFPLPSFFFCIFYKPVDVSNLVRCCGSPGGSARAMRTA